jgi:hypothetical protein
VNSGIADLLIKINTICMRTCDPRRSTSDIQPRCCAQPASSCSASSSGPRVLPLLTRGAVDATELIQAHRRRALSEFFTGSLASSSHCPDKAYRL